MPLPPRKPLPERLRAASTPRFRAFPPRGNMRKRAAAWCHFYGFFTAFLQLDKGAETRYPAAGHPAQTPSRRCGHGADEAARAEQRRQGQLRHAATGKFTMFAGARFRRGDGGRIEFFFMRGFSAPAARESKKKLRRRAPVLSSFLYTRARACARNKKCAAVFRRRRGREPILFPPPAADSFPPRAAPAARRASRRNTFSRPQREGSRRGSRARARS